MQFLIMALTLSQPAPFPSYSKALEMTGKHRIVFVNVQPRQIGKAVSTSVSYLKGFPDGVVIFDREGVHVATLPASASDATIAARLEGRPIQASPFSDTFSQRAAPRTADDDDAGPVGPFLSSREQKQLRALWPNNLPFPQGMRFYRPVQHSQYIANDVNHGDLIDVVRRTDDRYFQNSAPAANPNKLPHWRVPGGLADLPADAWASYTAVAITSGESIISFRRDVPVSNAPRGSLPKEQWAWPDGTMFADLLVNTETGKVFELRMRHKIGDGEWDSMVPFKNVAARPAGYVGAGKRCAECHDHEASESAQYFITLRRQDGTFSASPLVDGTLRLDRDNWPIERR